MMRFPDFIIGGAMKCGTTSLHRMLQRHPGIYMPPGESLFFTCDDIFQHANFFFHRGDRWYWRDFDLQRDRALAEYTESFKGAKDNQLIGEDSPSYLASHLAPQRIARLIPNVKLIFLLRDPVERVYSQYWHMLVRGRIAVSFEHAIRDVPTLLERSRYRDGLERYLRVFPKERMHVALFEDFVKAPERVAAGVLEFLGLSPAELEVSSAVQANRGRFPQWPALQRWINRRTDTLTRLAQVERIPEMPPPPALRFERLLRRIGRRLQVAERPPPMRTETRDLLRVLLERENRGLGALLGVDLSRA